MHVRMALLRAVVRPLCRPRPRCPNVYTSRQSIVQLGQRCLCSSSVSSSAEAPLAKGSSGFLQWCAANPIKFGVSVATVKTAVRCSTTHCSLGRSSHLGALSSAGGRPTDPEGHRGQVLGRHRLEEERTLHRLRLCLPGLLPVLPLRDALLALVCGRCALREPAFQSEAHGLCRAPQPVHRALCRAACPRSAVRDTCRACAVHRPCRCL